MAGSTAKKCTSLIFLFLSLKKMFSTDFQYLVAYPLAANTAWILLGMDLLNFWQRY
jgi:hypothetical protein